MGVEKDGFDTEKWILLHIQDSKKKSGHIFVNFEIS